LLSFLKTSDHYDLENALQICRGDEFARERVFILARSGDTKQALEIILMELCDVKAAVKFCKEYHSKDMWDCLVKFCMEKPQYIKDVNPAIDLIDNVGIDVESVDPIKVIWEMNPKYEMKDLRDSLKGLLQQYRSQINIYESCRRIMLPDDYGHILKQDQYYSKGTRIQYESKCAVCEKTLLKPILATGGPRNNYLPASSNNQCLKEGCACRCPGLSHLHGGKSSCTLKHSNHLEDDTQNDNHGHDTDTIILCVDMHTIINV